VSVSGSGGLVLWKMLLAEELSFLRVGGLKIQGSLANRALKERRKKKHPFNQQLVKMKTRGGLHLKQNLW